MARKNRLAEYRSFNKGFMTEASPLTFPENYSIDECNFVLDRDGSRRRRLGLRNEEGYQTNAHSTVASATGEIEASTYRWSDASKDFSREIAVVQVGSQIKFYEMTSSALSNSLIYTHTFYTDSTQDFLKFVGRVNFTSVNGILVVAYGSEEMLTFTYSGGAVVPSSNIRLRIRDLFGVDDIADVLDGSYDLRSSEYLGLRPEVSTNEHIYNLRNQGWGRGWRQLESNAEFVGDPVAYFLASSGTFFPSNADNINLGVSPNTEDSSDRVGERFSATAVFKNPGAQSESPRGSFVIDLLRRGTSRMEALVAMSVKEPGIPEALSGDIYDVTQLPVDRSFKGATCVETFAGRAWYAGFDNTLEGGDAYSPNINSFIAFSKLVKTSADLGSCFQAADPTSHVDSDLVDTDGGFLSIDGADRILNIVQAGSSLLVFASNGTWSVSGGSDFGFTATNYLVTKISEIGAVGVDSIVRVDDTVVFCSEDGIYAAVPDELNGWSLKSLTKGVIQSYYQNIPYLDRASCKAFYDSFDRKVKWLFYTRINSERGPQELIFDMDLEAFYKFDLVRPAASNLLPLAIIETTPYEVGVTNVLVTSEGLTVTSNGSDVFTTEEFGINSIREAMYVVSTGITESVSPTSQQLSLVSTTFSSYRDRSFRDWIDHDGVGFDAEAKLVTGYLPMSDVALQKQVPYATFHFYRTEDGFEEDELGDIYPVNESSCLVQPRWDWTNSSNSNRWGREFQAYRYRRLYMPSDVNDEYDTGHETIVTKNKIRGKGRVLSMRLRTEPNKDCRVLGWSMVVGSNENV